MSRTIQPSIFHGDRLEKFEFEAVNMPDSEWWGPSWRSRPALWEGERLFSIAYAAAARALQSCYTKIIKMNIMRKKDQWKWEPFTVQSHLSSLSHSNYLIVFNCNEYNCVELFTFVANTACLWWIRLTPLEAHPRHEEDCGWIIQINDGKSPLVSSAS